MIDGSWGLSIVYCSDALVVKLGKRSEPNCHRWAPEQGSYPQLLKMVFPCNCDWLCVKAMKENVNASYRFISFLATSNILHALCPARFIAGDTLPWHNPRWSHRASLRASNLAWEPVEQWPNTTWKSLWDALSSWQISASVVVKLTSFLICFGLFFFLKFTDD